MVFLLSNEQELPSTNQWNETSKISLLVEKLSLLAGITFFFNLEIFKFDNFLSSHIIKEIKEQEKIHTFLNTEMKTYYWS